MEYTDAEVEDIQGQAEERGKEIGYNEGVEEAMKIVAEYQHRGCNCSMCMDIDNIMSEIEKLKK